MVRNPNSGLVYFIVQEALIENTETCAATWSIAKAQCGPVRDILLFHIPRGPVLHI